jgi:hypothetical protein
MKSKETIRFLQRSYAGQLAPLACPDLCRLLDRPYHIPGKNCPVFVFLASHKGLSKGRLIWAYPKMNNNQNI